MFNLLKLLSPSQLWSSGSLGVGVGYFGGRMLVKSTNLGCRRAWAHFLSLPLKAK